MNLVEYAGLNQTTDNAAFIFITNGIAGFVPGFDSIPLMLGGIIRSQDELGELMPLLANATLEIDVNNTNPEGALGVGFTAPLLAGNYTVTISDNVPLNDYASYVIDIGFEAA